MLKKLRQAMAPVLKSAPDATQRSFTSDIQDAFLLDFPHESYWVVNELFMNS